MNNIEKQFERIKNGSIKLKVLCHNRPYLRDDNLEFKYMIGFGLLKKLFDFFNVDYNIKQAEFYFPERHINILEQRVLLNRILHYFPNIQSIHIETHSPFILSTIPNGYASVIQYENQVIESDQVDKILYNLDFKYE